jgi:putative membrane protein
MRAFTTTMASAALFVLAVVAAPSAQATDEKVGDAASTARATAGSATTNEAVVQPAAGTTGVAGIPSSDANFMMKAAGSGMAEVELARIALERSSNARVREHAQHMIDDHGKANDELEAIAKTKQVPLPDQPAGLQKDLVGKLQGLSGKDFDESYMQAEVGEHKAAVALFRDTKLTTKDPALRDFAAKTLPTLEAHLEEALKVTADVRTQG